MSILWNFFMQFMDTIKMLETAVAAARLAGGFAVEHIDYAGASLKTDGSIVTQYDRQCQEIIISQIRQNFPGHGFCAEEGGKNDDILKIEPAGNEKIWWLIDPIDGTNNFARGILSFSVSIAAMLDGQPVIGVVYDPTTNSMFTAAKDHPVQYNGRTIHANDFDINENEVIGIDSMHEKHVPAWANKLRCTLRCRSLGSTALHLAYVAKGSFIGMIVDKARLHDIAAGAIIAQQAGAVVSDWYGKNIFPIDIAAYDGRKTQTVAANRRIHGKLLQIISGGDAQ